MVSLALFRSEAFPATRGSRYTPTLGEDLWDLAGRFGTLSVLLVRDVVLPDRLLRDGLRDDVQAAAAPGARARPRRGSRSTLDQVTGECGVVDLFQVFQHFCPSVFQQIGLALKTHTSRDKGSQSLRTAYRYSCKNILLVHA